MNTVGDVDMVMKKTRGAWYEDGLADLTLGGYAFAVGLMLLGQAFTPEGAALWMLWGVATPLVLLVGGATAGWFLRRLKTRLVYPRAGFVSFEKRGISGVARMLWTALIAAAVAAASVVLSGKLANLSLIFGLGLGAAFTYIWQRVGLARYFALALWSLATGAAIVTLPLSMELGGALFWVLAGAGLIVSGILAWRHFDHSISALEAADETGN